MLVISPSYNQFSDIAWWESPACSDICVCPGRTVSCLNSRPSAVRYKNFRTEAAPRTASCASTSGPFCSTFSNTLTIAPAIFYRNGLLRVTCVAFAVCWCCVVHAEILFFLNGAHSVPVLCISFEKWPWWCLICLQKQPFSKPVKNDPMLLRLISAWN